MLRFGVVELYCGDSGKIGYYNSQEIGIAKAMKKLGYDCYIFYPSFSDSKEFEKELIDGIMVVNCPAIKFGMHSKYDWNVLLDYKIDIVHIDGDNQIFAPDVIHFCRKYKIINYTYSGSMTSGNSNFFKKAIMSFIFLRNIREYRKTFNFAKTEHVKKTLMDKKINCASEIVPVGLDLTIIPDAICVNKIQLRKRLNIPLDKNILLFVGRIDKYKHPMDMINLINKLPEAFFSIIIGDGALSKELEKQIYENHLVERVLWLKKLPNVEIHSYYALADYLLNFNPNEIFGMCILEALYQGCTVIAVHAPGPDLILSENHGFLVDNLEDMLNIINKREQLDSRELRDYIINNFSWDNAAQKFDAYIKTCLSQCERKSN